MVAPNQTTSRQRRFLPGPALAGLLSFVALVSLFFVPVLGAFFALLASLPLVHLAAAGRSSVLAWGWVALALAGAALLSKSTWLVAVLLAYLLLAALPAYSVETWMRHSWATGRWVAGITLTALAATTGFAVAISFPVAPATALAERLQTAVDEATRAFGQLGAGLGTEEMLARAVELTSYLAPALATMYVLSAVLWLRPRLPLLGIGRGDEPFALYASEEWLPVGFALGGLGWVFTGGLVKWLSTNLFVTVLGLYFLHGLAIIHFYLGRRLSANRWVRLAVAVFAMQIPVALVLSVLGLTDAFVRLRRGGAYSGGSEV